MGHCQTKHCCASCLPQSKLGLGKVSCVAWKNAQHLFPKSAQIRGSTIAKHFSLTMPLESLRCCRLAISNNSLVSADAKPITSKWKITAPRTAPVRKSSGWPLRNLSNPMKTLHASSLTLLRLHNTTNDLLINDLTGSASDR